MSSVEFVELLHPRDFQGRFRNKLSDDIKTAFRHFDSLDDTEGWQSQHWDSWRDNLSMREENSIYSYGNFGYADMNSVLRTDSLESASQDVRNDVTGLDSALDSTEMPEGVIAFRGLFQSDVLDAFEQDDLETLQGFEFSDRGFASVSLDVVTAFSHMSDDPEGILARIYIPKGARAASVSDITGRPEAEVLLPRGSRFYVRKALRNDAGVRVLHLELLPESS